MELAGADGERLGDAVEYRGVEAVKEVVTEAMKKDGRFYNSTWIFHNVRLH